MVVGRRGEYEIIACKHVAPRERERRTRPRAQQRRAGVEIHASHRAVRISRIRGERDVIAGGEDHARRGADKLDDRRCVRKQPTSEARGRFCSGLRERSTHQQFVVAQRQSIYIRVVSLDAGAERKPIRPVPTRERKRLKSVDAREQAARIKITTDHLQSANGKDASGHIQRAGDGRPIGAVPAHEIRHRLTARRADLSTGKQFRATHSERINYHAWTGRRDARANRVPFGAIPPGDVIDGEAAGSEETASRVKVRPARRQREHVAIKALAERGPRLPIPFGYVLGRKSSATRETAACKQFTGIAHHQRAHGAVQAVRRPDTQR